MQTKYCGSVLFLLIVLVVIFGGLFIGRIIMHNKMVTSNTNSTEWHVVLHNELKLTPEQNKKIEKPEEEYNQTNNILKKQMHVANMKLADALRKDASYSTNVQTAVDEIHHVMGKMQKVTIQHLLNIRPILTVEQTEKLEQLITNALYQSTEEHKHQ